MDMHRDVEDGPHVGWGKERACRKIHTKEEIEASRSLRAAESPAGSMRTTEAMSHKRNRKTYIV